MSSKYKTYLVNTKGQPCPVPLVATRKAIRKASPGDIIEVHGDHPPSKKEIPMAVEALKLKLLSVEENREEWVIRIQIPEKES